MDSLENLKQMRLGWVKSSRDNDFEEGINHLLTELYPDNAHFIYELLQNAEDTHASRAHFTLTDEVLEFEHNGEKLFSFENVVSITNIGKSTKRGDPTRIGKFGVGFKAVFAYTNTPEIHSGEFHFRIHDLVVPETDGVPKPAMGDRETRFIFPFDHPTKRAETAVGEVESTLRALGDNTLLFLSHIRTIEYSLPDGSLGYLERIEHPGGRIEIKASHPGGQDTVSHWLRFQKCVEVGDEDGELKSCKIAIAYRIEEEADNKKRRGGWKVVPLEHGEVSIYFPAKKERSSLRFHMHAPFASTVGRDSVRDCEANGQLRDHISELVVESLSSIRDQGMLTMRFLAVLPNPEDGLSGFYEPIRQAVVNAFRDQPFTPTRTGSHAPATTLYRGPARISEVLDDDDLSLLTNYSTPLWAANPQQQNQREDRFLDSLEIDDWELPELLKFLGYGSEIYAIYRERIHKLIEKKDDSGVMRFYALLGEACGNQDITINANLRIVRVEGADNEHVSADAAFFPPEEESDPIMDIRFVKSSVYKTGRASEGQKNHAVAFLRHIGVRPFDEKTIIELRLSHYAHLPPPSLSDHYKDLGRFVKYWRNNSDDVVIFGKHRFLLGLTEDGDVNWRQPSDLCLDEPYEDTGLSIYSYIHGKELIWGNYKGKLPESMLNDFIDFLKAIGVMHGLDIERACCSKNPESLNLRRDWLKKYNKITDSAIDEDYSILGLDEYFEGIDVSSSRLIWNALINADPKVSKARFRPNRQHEIRTADSQLVHHLKRAAWIPDSQGKFHKPEEMTKDDLSPDFPFDDRNGLLTAIGFGELAKKEDQEYQAKEKLAQDAGFASPQELQDMQEVRTIANAHNLGTSELKEILNAYALKRRTARPEESVPNPEKRRSGVLEHRDNAPNKESIRRERKLITETDAAIAKAKPYLRDRYRNEVGQLVCQCCNDEMPFKVRDDYYFEAVECLKLDRHYRENRLALCPTCAAMYKHALDTDESDIRQAIVENPVADTAPSVQIPIMLAGNRRELHFVGKHWFDLKTLLSK